MDDEPARIGKQMTSIAALVAGLFRAHWPVIVTGTTVTFAAAGISYLHAYYGTLGFGGLVFSLPLATHVTWGAIASLVVFTPEFVLTSLIIVSAISLRDVAKWVSGKMPNTEMARRLQAVRAGALEPLAPAAAIFVLVIVAVLPWQWVFPTFGQLLVWPGPLGPLLLRANVIVFASFWVIMGFVALLGLRGRGRAAFTIALMLVSMPALASQLGEQRAHDLIKRPDAYDRVLVWTNETQTVPAGYVLVHQDDDRLYLLLLTNVTDPQTKANKTIPIATALDVSKVARVEFVPANVMVEWSRFENATG